MKVPLKAAKKHTYSLVDKARIIQEAYSIDRNVNATARKYNVRRQQITDWKKKGILDLYLAHQAPIAPVYRQTAAVLANQMEFGADDNMDMNAANNMETHLNRQSHLKDRKRVTRAYRLKGGGRKFTMPEEFERQLRGFFVEMRDESLPVDMNVLITQAHLLDPMCSINVSPDGFRQRIYRHLIDWGAAYRQGTHKAQEKKLHLKTMKDFHTYIRMKCAMLGIEKNAVFNFDETNVYFSPDVSSSWTAKGTATVDILEEKSSQRCTAMLGSSMTGEKVPPFLIYTGATTRNGRIKKMLEQPEKYGYPIGMQYAVQESGWMDEVTMINWIKKTWCPISQQFETTMIVVDSCTSHLTTSVMNEFALCNTEVEVIPGGFTSKLQPMDVGINKPFKGKVRTQYMNWMILNSAERRNEPNNTNRMPRAKPHRTTIAKWIESAWKRY